MKIYERLPKESHSEFAYHILRKNILKFELKPGETINEKKIAEQLNISRTPVHEAVLKLRDEHMIDIKARRESTVSYLDIDKIKEGFFVRKILDREILCLAARNISSEWRKQLKDNLDTQQRMIEEDDLEEYLEWDDAFHRLIYLAVDKPITYNIMMNASSHLTRMRNLIQILHAYDYISESFRDHQKIMELIVFGFPEDFDPALFVEDHMKGFQNFLPSIENKYKQYFV